ncbi:MAG: hypothetical protein AAF682_13615 [Planctomycetota bacterium]
MLHRALSLTAGLLVAGATTFAQVDQESWNEDPTRLHRKTAAQMSPARYRAALEATGMLGAIERNVERRRVREGDDGEAIDVLGSGWTVAGPVGGFSGRNGRVSNVQLVPFFFDVLVYVGACQGGIWRASLSDLDTWTPVADSLPNPAARSFAVKSGNPDVIVVGTGEDGRYKGAGIYRSGDGGATWVQGAIGGGLDPVYFWRVVEAGSSVWLAASDDALLRSTDDGFTWNSVQTGLFTDLIAHPTNPTTFYALKRGTGGILRSTDGGLNWSVTLTDPVFAPAASWARGTLAICRNQPENMAVFVSDGALNVAGIYRTADSGTTWTDITGPTPSFWAFGGDQLFHTHALAIHPDDPDRIFAAGRGLAVTDDGGATWMDGTDEHGIDIGHADFAKLHFDPMTGSDSLWFCNDGGLYRYSMSGDTTEDQLGGVDGLAISEIDFMDADREVRIIGLQDNGVVRSVDAGASWTLLGGGDGADVKVVQSVLNHVWYSLGVFGAPVAWRVFRHEYGGSAVDMENEPEYQTPIFHDPFEDLVYQGGNDRLYVQAQSAPPDSWTQLVTTGWSQDPGWNLRRIWGSRANGRSLFVNYWAGNDADVTIFELPPGGSVWQAHHYEALFPGGERVEFVAPSTEWPGECWVGGGVQIDASSGHAQLFHTTDYGATWTDLTNELSACNRVLSFANTPFDPMTLYAGTDIGVFRSLDGGQSWHPFIEDFPVAPVSELVFVPNDAQGATHRLIAATNGRGLWSRDIPGDPVLYVDRTAQSPWGFQDGSFEYPYLTVAAAIAAAPAGSAIAIRAETYAEPITTTKSVRLVTWAGSSVLQ